ncbi:glycosyltransferase [Butyrivibrio sp. AE3006]|uniref:glycosyltransferase n=1 Tax=Butyrivibrio sp. AE3006 TaxID=1280673 RepID=UPI0004265DE6|nr:glycosyltransferase [Butyrivibrio sp. AE3006]
MKKHAYLIIAHNEFHMLRKLISELDDERNDIYLHIDKKTRYVDEQKISSWVNKSRIYFIRPMKIYWGTISVLKCELKLLEAATIQKYHYYHLISGVDFPLKSQDYIHELLEDESSQFIRCHRAGEENDSFLYKVRYFYPLLGMVGKDDFMGPGKKNKFMRSLVKIQWKSVEIQKRLGIDRTKKDKGLCFYKGDQWFSITHELALFILQNKDELIKRYKLTNGPDEIAISTLAMNSEFAGNIKNNSLRMIDWEKGDPYEYKLEDLNELEQSEAVFARKISFDNAPDLVNALAYNLHSESRSDEEPLISVIVPCYNVENYLAECVDSLLRQTYKNLEILLVDDGSTDDTGKIAGKYADKNENISYIYRENGGLSAARNTGIDNSNGRYIAFVDSDDWVDCDYFSKLYEAIRTGNADIAVCGYKKEDAEQGIVTFDESKVLSSHSAMKYLGDIYPKENVLLIIACNKLFKREIFASYRFLEGKIHEDEFAAHRIIAEADSVSVISDTLYHYRIREGSITSSDRAQSLRRLDYLDALQDRLEYTENMMYGDLQIYMLYTYFEGMKELMVTYTEETIRKNRLYAYFRSKAFKVYIRRFFDLDGYQKKKYMEIILFPSKFRLSEIKRREKQK